MGEEAKTTGMSVRIADTIMRLRVLILIICAALTLVFAFGLTRLQIRVQLDEMVPPLHPYIKLNQRFLKVFGGSNTVAIEVKAREGDIFNKEILGKIKRITDEIQYHPYVRRALVASISKRKMKAVRGYSGGEIDVSALMYPDLPQNRQEMNTLKENIFTNEFYRGVLVSNDQTAALIFADLEEYGVDYGKFFKFIEKNIVQKEEDDKATIHVAGFPILMGWIHHFLPAMNTIFVVTIIAVLLMLILIFRHLMGVVIPLVVGFASTIWGLGFIGLFGISLDPLMLVLPFLVGARALSHSVQTTRRYLEEYTKSGEDFKAAHATINALFLASLSAIVTDAAGFLVLVLARILVIQKLALLCTFWVVSIFVLVAVVGPILALYLPNPKKVHLGGSRAIEKFMMTIGGWELKKSGAWTVIMGFIVIGVIGGFYASKITVGDIHPGSSILWEDSRYNQDVAEINKRFDDAGCDTMNIVLEGVPNCTEMPEVLYKMEGFTDMIKHTIPEVGGTQCLVNIVKKLNMEFHEGDPKWYVIPESILASGSYILMYRSMGDSGDFDVWTDPKFEKGSIRVYFKDHRADTINRALAASKEFLNTYPELVQKEKFMEVYNRLKQMYPELKLDEQGFVGKVTQDVMEFRPKKFLAYLASKSDMVKSTKFIKSFPSLFSKEKLIDDYPDIQKMTMKEFVDKHKEAYPMMELLEQDEFMSAERFGIVQFELAGGVIGVLAAINEEIEWSQTGTLLMIFLIVFAFCSIVFRSIVAGTILAIPLLVANLATFIYMVKNEIGLDINTLPVFAVGIGVGVDYGIYVLSRFQEEYDKLGNMEEAIIKGMTTSGLGVVFTAVTLTVPVLLWYFISELKFQAQMGILLAFLLVFNMFGALFFLPSMCGLIKPKFIKHVSSAA
jgi:predicted RND superfamily exporter protein